MIYAILLLILAALLFGSSAIIGFLGAVLGFIAAAVALFWISISLHIAPVYVLIFGVVGFFVLCGLVMLIAALLEPREAKKRDAYIHGLFKEKKPSRLP